MFGFSCRKMQTIMKKFMIIAAGLVIALSAAAQTGDAQGVQKKDHHRKPLTVEQEARMRVKKMTKELDLTDGQAKKLLKFYEKDIRYRRENFPTVGKYGHMGMHHEGQQCDSCKMHGKPEARPEKGQRDSAFHPHHPQHHAKPQGKPGARPEGKPGVRPDGPRHSHDHNGHGMRPDAPKEIDYDALEKFNERQDNTLKKILGEEKFNLWRSKHPRKPLPLPEV